MNNIGNYIREYRGKTSLRDFAEKCGISHTHLDSIEKGIDPRTGKPVKVTVETLKKIANAMNMSVNDLLLKSGDIKYEDIIYEMEQTKVNFSLTLFELMRYYQLNNKSLSEKLNISEERMDEFIKQKALPNDDELKKMVDFFALKNKEELFNGDAIQRIIKKYEEAGNELIDKYKFGFELENMLDEISTELNVSIEVIKALIFNRKNDLNLLITYEDLYKFLKEYFSKKINSD